MYQGSFAFHRRWEQGLLHSTRQGERDSVPGLQRAWEFSTTVLQQVEENLNAESMQGIATVALAGSFGRMEGNPNSDFDLVVIAQENSAADRAEEQRLFEQVWSKLADMSLVPPDDHGIFRRVIPASTLYDEDALGNLDYPKHVFGLRMQLLTDCQPVLCAEAFEALQGNIIRWYCKPGYSPFAASPLQYLLSDLKRYFHSYANWHQYRFDKTFNDSWLMRQVKMNHSRLASYTALVFCLLQIASQTDALHSEENEERICDLLLPMLRMTPLERLVCHWPEQQHQQLNEYLQLYNRVSAIISDPLTRQALIDVQPEDVSDIRKLASESAGMAGAELQDVFEELTKAVLQMRQLLAQSMEQLCVNNGQDERDMEAVKRRVNGGPVMRIADIIALSVLVLSVLIAGACYIYYKHFDKPENAFIAVTDGAYIDAARMLKDSADSGSVSAEISLANLYRFGLGVPQDYPAAVLMYWNSAKQGHVSGMVNLALMYRQGLGVEKDAEVAYAWLDLARDRRSKVAQLYMSEMLANYELSAHRVPQVKKMFSTVESMPEPRGCTCPVTQGRISRLYFRLYFQTVLQGQAQA